MGRGWRPAEVLIVSRKVYDATDAASLRSRCLKKRRAAQAARLRGKDILSSYFCNSYVNIFISCYSSTIVGLIQPLDHLLFSLRVFSVHK